jgi:cytochrome c oxidase subunit 4
MADDAKAAAVHVTPAKIYLAVAAALFILTALTVRISEIDFGPWNMVIALTIAGIKITLVGLIFMHLFYDNKLYFAIFFVAISFLVVFMTLTMFDTMRRGDIYQEEMAPINPEAVIYQKGSHAATTHDSAKAVEFSDSTHSADSAISSNSDNNHESH